MTRGPTPGGYQAGLLPVVFAVALTLTPEFDYQGIPKVRLTDLMLPLLLMACLSHQSGSRHERAQPIPLMVPMALVMLWDLTALALGVAPFTPGIFYLGKRLAYFLIFAYGVTVARQGESWRSAVKAIVFSSPLLGASVWLEQSLHADNASFRASGIISNQEQSTAYFLVLVIGLILGLWPALSRPGERVGLTLALAAGIKTLLATGTRGGLVLMAMVSGLVLYGSRRSPVPLTILLLLLGYVSWIFTPEGLQDRLSELHRESQTLWVGATSGTDALVERTGDSSVASRMVAASWVYSTMIAESPLSGCGTAFRKLGFCDNMYFTEWVYHGLVGLLLWLAFQLGLGRELWQARQNLSGPLERGLANAMLATWATYSVGALNADIFYLIRPCEGFFLTAGLVVGLGRRETHRPKPRPRFTPLPSPPHGG